MEMNAGNVLIVGCGPGSADFVTPAARQAVAEAKIIFGAQRLLDLFPQAQGRRVVVDSHIEPLLAEIEKLAQAGATVAVLVSGDPGLFSLARSIVRRIGRQRCRVVPGVSSLQVALARLGLDWADCRIISAHARTPRESADDLRAADKIAVLAGTKEAVEWIAAVAGKLAATHELFLCQDLTLPGERVRELSPEELTTGPVSSLAIAILVRGELLS